MDVEVLENIMKFNHRRKKDQERVYALILGTVSGLNFYHIKNILYGYLYPSGNKDSQGKLKVCIFI